MRVVLGGERRIDVARAYGYSDGSAITQLLKRVEQFAKEDTVLALQMKELRRECAQLTSSVKS